MRVRGGHSWWSSSTSSNTKNIFQKPQPTQIYQRLYLSQIISVSQKLSFNVILVKHTITQNKKQHKKIKFQRENHTTKSVLNTCNLNLKHVISHHTLIQTARGLSHQNPYNKRNPSTSVLSPETHLRVAGDKNPNLNLMQKIKTSGSSSYG